MPRANPLAALLDVAVGGATSEKDADDRALDTAGQNEAQDDVVAARGLWGGDCYGNAHARPTPSDTFGGDSRAHSWQ